MSEEFAKIIEKTRPIRVLYVEDDKDVKDTFTEFLKLVFENIFIATSGEEALKIANDNILDLAIIDIKLPKMDGLSLIKELKHKYNDIKILVISAHQENSYIEKAYKLGALEYLIKPLNVEQFFKFLREKL